MGADRTMRSMRGQQNMQREWRISGVWGWLSANKHFDLIASSQINQNPQGIFNGEWIFTAASAV